ncbi:MAG: hypothetical protein ACYC3I_06115 [Gemmataceae bacterium]
MYLPVRRFLGLFLGVLTFLGPLAVKGQAQPRPAINPANVAAAARGAIGLSLNPYVNPFAATGLYHIPPQTVLANAAFTHPLAALSGAGWGWNSGLFAGRVGGMNAGYNLGATNSPMARLGYASMMNGGAAGGYGAMGGNGALAGSLLNSAIGGAGYGYGMSIGMTQWMMNPYEGYLQGVADVTRAQSDYYKGIQQAKLTRQEVIRSSLETRRALIEEQEWERAHMPDPEKIRQAALERELTIARISPPLNEVWTGRALNALLRHLVTQQGDGVRGPSVPLNPDTVKHINVKVGDTNGNVSLLKNKGELDWPEPLQGGIFKDSRESINSLMRTAFNSVNSGNNPDAATLNDLQTQYKKMREALTNNVDRLKPDEYFEAGRYLEEVKQNIKGLQDPNIGHQFNEDWKPTKARNVAELVRHMREKGLQFAPASEDDQPAYMSLYHALAAFDAGIPRVASTTSGGDNK